MKAVVLNKVGGPLTIEERPMPEIAENEVLVRLKAAALNRRDYWIQQGMYPRIQLPCIPGSDGAGVVEAVGEKVRNTKPGKEVIINPGMNWGNRKEVASENFTILGMPQDGTFAQYVKVESGYVYPKPPHLGFEQAAALPLAGVTAYRSLFSRAGARYGEKMLISGIGGGVAMQALQFALAHGQEVYVTSGSEDKLKKARQAGAHGGANYREENWHKKLKAETGLFEVIVDSAGGADFSKLVDLAAPAGRITIYGGTTGNISGIVPAKIFFKELTIMGSTMGNDQDFESMVLLVNAHQIEPVVDTVFPLEEAQQAVEYLARGQHLGKVALRID